MDMLLKYYLYNPIKLKLHLYKALELDNSHSHNGDLYDNSWQQYTTEDLTIYGISGNHNSMLFNPGLSEIADYINSDLSS